MCHTDLAIQETEKFNEVETSIPERDFVGLDFTAWVYDLFNPDRPYTDRGIHPSGIGIDRYIKPNDLYPEEYNYLTKQGYLQLTNLLSPFIFGKNAFYLNSGIKFNFALRHILTSFGYEIVAQSFIKGHSNFIFSLHLYKNKHLTLPGFDFELYRQKAGKNTYITFNTILGLQPKNLLFYDKNFQALGYVNLQIEKYFRNFGIYSGLSFKTQGWIQGETYQTASANFRFGFCFQNLK
jgi:hypothetical protein